jgi:hypothetical protein
LTRYKNWNLVHVLKSEASRESRQKHKTWPIIAEADCCLFNVFLFSLSYPPYEALRYPGWCQTGLPVEKFER